MKKSELKKILKPLVKECIKESILEEGILSGIISEVTKGLSSKIVVEQKAVQTPAPVEAQVQAPSVNERIAEHRKKLMSAIGGDAYNGIDLLEGTTPAPAARSPEAQAGSPLGGMDPNDSGIDITGIMAVGGNKWKDLIK